MKIQTFRHVLVALAGGFLLFAGSISHAAFVSFTASGANNAGIQSTVDAFRIALGTLNANVAGSFGSGRREINWDGVPDALSAPNNLPANFFNVNSPRGVVFSTPGTGFEVSANAASGIPVEFGNINASYPGFFDAFSSPRLFTALGSTITDVNFFIPGSSTPAVTNGFGVVFSDVDLANITSLSFFDSNNNQVGNTFFAPPFAGNNTFSFLGVVFDQANISRVRITSGNQILSAANTADDLVVMDDFIYGEARLLVPEPAPLALLAIALGIAALALRRRSRSA